MVELGVLVSNTRWPYNVDGFRNKARRRLPKPLFDFVDGGSEDEVTLRANREQFSQLRFAPRLLEDVESRSLETTVGGTVLRLPLVFAPTGLVGLVHPDGEKASAIVAAREQLLSVVSGHSTYTMEEIAEAGPGQWFNMFPWRDQSFYGAMMERASKAGYRGLCLTVDTTVGSNRERDIANGWVSPPRLTAHAHRYAVHPRWVFSTLVNRRGTLRNFNSTTPPLRTFVRRASRSAAGAVGFISQTLSWKDLEWIRANWSGPLAVKGAIGVEDAKHLADIGVEVLFVGNHGGRQLDGLPAGLEQLVDLADAVGSQIDLVLDGGIRRGSDVVKAVCLGAKAAMIGRAWLFGLAVGGTSGVHEVVRVLEREIDMTMALLGVKSLSSLDRSYLRIAGLTDADLQKR